MAIWDGRSAYVLILLQQQLTPLLFNFSIVVGTLYNLYDVLEEIGSEMGKLSLMERGQRVAHWRNVFRDGCSCVASGSWAGLVEASNGSTSVIQSVRLHVHGSYIECTVLECQDIATRDP